MNNELEDMRQQMAALKKKLDEQEIVNDRIIRQSMKRNVLNINRKYYIVMALGLFMIPYGYWVFVKLSGFSMAFWIGTSIFMLVCVANTYITGRDLRADSLIQDDLLEARRKVARAKKRDSQWLLVGIPLVVLWMMWFFYECTTTESSEGLGSIPNEPLAWGGVVGGIVGTIIGLKIHFKTQHQYEEIIDQIENLTASE
ncbi:MAG: hypothetical protein K5683_09155 [Prevotella sp.]|nr:hypothetical protein [Prevotella sp.]